MAKRTKKKSKTTARPSARKPASQPAKRPGGNVGRGAGFTSRDGRAGSGGSTPGPDGRAAVTATISNADPVGSLTDEQLAARIRMQTAQGNTVELFQSNGELYMRVR